MLYITFFISYIIYILCYFNYIIYIYSFSISKIVTLYYIATVMRCAHALTKEACYAAAFQPHAQLLHSHMSVAVRIHADEDLPNALLGTEDTGHWETAGRVTGRLVQDGARLIGNSGHAQILFSQIQPNQLNSKESGQATASKWINGYTKQQC